MSLRWEDFFAHSAQHPVAVVSRMIEFMVSQMPIKVPATRMMRTLRGGCRCSRARVHVHTERTFFTVENTTLGVKQFLNHR